MGQGAGQVLLHRAIGDFQASRHLGMGQPLQTVETEDLTGARRQFGDYLAQAGKRIGIHRGLLGAGLVGDEPGEVIVGPGLGAAPPFLPVMVDGEVVRGAVEIGVDMLDRLLVPLLGQAQEALMAKASCASGNSSRQSNAQGIERRPPLATDQT